MNNKTPEAIKNIPEKIDLQLGEDIEGVKDFKEFHSEAISWCADKIYDTDIEYVINNESLIEEIREALEFFSLLSPVYYNDLAGGIMKANTVLQKIKSKS